MSSLLTLILYGFAHLRVQQLPLFLNLFLSLLDFVPCSRLLRLFKLVILMIFDVVGVICIQFTNILLVHAD